MMRLLRVIIVTLVIGSVCADAENNAFKSVTAGLEVTKPSTWTFVTADENKEHLKRAKLDDAEFQKQMQKYATAPLVAMTKYPEPYDDLNPSLKINIKPLGQLKGADGKMILALILPQLQKVFKDYKLVQDPMDTEISGLKAGYARLSYSLQSQDGRTFPITSELWIVPRGDYFFMVGAGTRQDEKTGTRKEISEIMKSLKIEK